MPTPTTKPPPQHVLIETTRHLERKCALQWMNNIRKELGLPRIGLSERNRTCGAEVSMASTLAQYQTIIRGKGKSLIAVMDRLRICKEGGPKPAQRLEDLAYLLARVDELDLDEEIFSDLTLTGQVNAVCASLKARKRLCRLCLSTSERLTEISSRVKEIGNELDEMIWPPRDFGEGVSEALTDGIRFLPPEKVEDSGDIPCNVIRHYDNGATLLESARDCPFCELLRMAIMLDCFRRYSFPLDRPTHQLPEMIMGIRMGRGLEGEFEQIIEGIKGSRNAI